MKVNVSNVPVGVKFNYKGMEYVVVEREEYPFVECKCVTEPNEYEHNVLFGGAGEVVDVPDGTKVYKSRFVEVSPHYYVMKEELV